MLRSENFLRVGANVLNFLSEVSTDFTETGLLYFFSIESKNLGFVFEQFGFFKLVLLKARVELAVLEIHVGLFLHSFKL